MALNLPCAPPSSFFQQLPRGSDPTVNGTPTHSRRLRDFRPLRLLIALFLAIPVVLFSSSAGHAALYENVEVVIENAGPMPNVSCAWSHSLAAEVYTVGGGYCEAPNLPTGICQYPEAECTAVRIEVHGLVGGDGADCSALVGLSTVAASSWTKARVTFGEHTTTLGTCEPVEVCVFMNGKDGEERACVATTLELPPPLAECQYGTFGASVTSPLGTATESRTAYHNVVTQRAGVTGEGVNDGPAPAPGGRWWWYTVESLDGLAGPLVGFPAGQSAWETFPAITIENTSGSAIQVENSRLAPGARSADTRIPTRFLTYFDTNLPRTIGLNANNVTAYKPGYTGSQGGGVQEFSLRGVGVFYLDNGLFAPSTTPVGEKPGSVFGRHDPAACSFYWGEKIADVPGTDVDEPGGPLVPEVDPGDPTEPPVPPEDETPENEFDFWDSILGILRLIWEAVKAVPGRILAGLESLLIPDPDSWGFDALWDQLDHRAPFSVLQDLGDGVEAMATEYSGAGECGVIADFSTPGQSATLNCSTVKSIPGYGGLYSLVSAGLVCLTGMGMWNMFSATLERGQ